MKGNLAHFPISSKRLQLLLSAFVYKSLEEYKKSFIVRDFYRKE